MIRKGDLIHDANLTVGMTRGSCFGSFTFHRGYINKTGSLCISGVAATPVERPLVCAQVLMEVSRLTDG